MNEDLAGGVPAAQDVPRTEPDVPQDTAGARLRAAREAAGLHIGSLAVTMKVPVGKLQALEADRWDLLPDAVFVRALAASVCRTLKCDAAPVLHLLPQVTTPRLVADDSRGINTPFRADARSVAVSTQTYLPRPTVVLVGALLLAALAVLLVPEVHIPGMQAAIGVDVATPLPVVAESARDLPVEPQTNAQPAATVALAAEPPASAPVTAGASAPGSGAAAPVLALAPTAVAPTVAGAAAAPGAAGSAPAARALVPGLITLTAHATSWVEILDGRKQVLIRRALQAGEAQSFAAEPPLSVIVGRADAVSVVVRGAALNLAPVTVSNVARFEVK